MLPTNRSRSPRHRAGRPPTGRHRGERSPLARPIGLVGAVVATVAASVLGLGLSAGADRGTPAEAADPAATAVTLQPTGPTPVVTSAPIDSERAGRSQPSATPPADTQPAQRNRVDRATATKVPERAGGTFRIAGGTAAAVGHGRLVTYTVEVEDGLPFRPAEVARLVDDVLGDRRGWTSVSAHRLQRVTADPNYRIRLASPATADRLCAPLRTQGRLSCRNGQNVVLNAWRWVHGAEGYRDISAYRTYLINHEFGHALGNGHEACPGKGELAPVMLQQTKTLDGCAPNPWPMP